jgi:GMP synthase (glutamine-hydrolysing)
MINHTTLRSSEKLYNFSFKIRRVKMEVNEINTEDLNPDEFIQEQIEKISRTIKDGLAINALSGRVDSSTVTMIGHKALGDRLKTYFIESGLMREG